MDRFKEVKEALREAWLLESSTAQHESAYQVFVDFVKQNQTNVALFVLFVSLAIRQIVSKNREAAKKGANRQFLEAPDFPEVETLENFDWKKEDTVKLRAFKPKFHLTMGESAHAHRPRVLACLSMTTYLLCSRAWTRSDQKI